MFTYADQVGKKIKEDKIQKNIKNVYLRKPGWKKLKKTKYKNIKNVYLCNQVGKKIKKDKIQKKI